MTICLAWDIDGTLLSKRPHAPSVDGALIHDVVDHLAVEIGPIEPSWGKTELQIFTELFGPELAPAALARYETAWSERWDPSHYEAHAGIAEVLTALDTPSHAHVILTGNTLRRARDKVGAVGLERHFDWERGAYGAESVDRGDLVGNVLERTGLPVVVIGDTPRDIHAAHAHASCVVAVATGRFTVDELTAEGADLVIADFEAGRDEFYAFVEAVRG